MLEYCLLQYLSDFSSLIFLKSGCNCGNLEREHVSLFLSEVCIARKLHLKHALDRMQ